MTQHNLDTLMLTILPEKSTRRYARILGVNPRSAARFYDDLEWTPTPAQASKVLEQQDHLRTTALRKRLSDLIADALAGGVDAEVVGAYLAHAHGQILGRDLE